MATKSAPPETNTPVLTFTPSLWSRGGVLALCILGAVLVVPIFIGLWIVLVVKNTRYTLTSERMMLTTGVLNRKTDNLELYRVTDLTLSQSFFQRLVGIGNIHLVSTDRTTPTLDIRGVRQHTHIADTLRDLSEKLRHRRGQREFDVV